MAPHGDPNRFYVWVNLCPPGLRRTEDPTRIMMAIRDPVNLGFNHARNGIVTEWKYLTEAEKLMIVAMLARRACGSEDALSTPSGTLSTPTGGTGEP